MMRILILIPIVLVALSYDAHAYLDPGTGSYMLQIVIAGIVSALFTLKLFGRKLVAFFSELFKGKK
jgi:hypothetical protein